MRCTVATIAFLLLPYALEAQRPTVDAVTKGKSCGVVSLGDTADGPSEHYCEYNVSGQLEFSIYWSFSGKVTIAVSQASEVVPGYTLSYDVGGGCITVTPNAATIRAMVRAEHAPDFAYVSPKTGGVYETEADCRKAS